MYIRVCRYRGSSLWLWIRELAKGGQKGRRPSGRVLLCGAVAFLWEREKIGNEEVIRYVNMYTHVTCTCTFAYEY